MIKTEERNEILEKLSIGLLIAIIFIIVFNLYRTSSLSDNTTSAVVGTIIKQQSTGYVDVTPKGIPRIYGEKLGVSYDDISISDQKKADKIIGDIGNLDNKVILNDNEMKRYISIAMNIGCEYCCGAESIIFSNGQAACGCSHSYAMRGLAKYLIKYHPNEFTDSQILEELGKWKTLFFPDNIGRKAFILKSKGIELNYINLASNKYRNIEKGVDTNNGAMVGGC